MLQRKIIRTVSSFLLLSLTESTAPSTLKKYALDAISDSFQDIDVYDISKRIYPNMLNANIPLENTGIMNIFFYELPYNKEVDLSYMNKERIPMVLARKMKNVEKLNLSNGQSWKLNEEWFEQFSSNLKELSLRNCYLKTSDFEAIDNLRALESLCISENCNLNVNSPRFISIIKRLKHLDVSYCRLSEKSLNTIFKHATKLESLNFSGNILNRMFNTSSISPEIIKNLKVLKLRRCELVSSDLESIFMFDNLIELDLSLNHFSEINANTLQKLFESTSIDPSFTEHPKFRRNIIKNLKSLSLQGCRIISKTFVEKIFDLQSLEALDISDNFLINFDFSEIVKGRARNSLKVLNVKKCNFSGPTNLKSLTSFPHLETLDISSNYLETIPIGFEIGCSKNSLKSVFIEFSHLTYLGLQPFTDCPKLEVLNASLNDFRDMPQDFTLGSSKHSLKSVKIDRSSLKPQGLRAFTDCIHLENLSACGSDFEYISEDFVFGCSKNSLKTIIIESVKLSHHVLCIFTDCPKLTKLVASFNLFFMIPEAFALGCSKHSLKDIKISNCGLNRHGLRAFTDCCNLERLSAHGNSLGDIPEGFTLKCSKNSLKEINLAECNLNINGLKAIADCHNLEKLSVSGNRFNEITEDFTLGCSRNSLKEINISNSYLNHYGLKAVTNCCKLEKLYVSGNEFGNIPEDFTFGCSKDSLKELEIFDCSLSYYGLKTVTECTKLEKLNISLNCFENIPKDFTFGYSKDSLTKLFVTYSKLKYNGLKAISYCTRLKTLNIVNNGFSLMNTEQKLILECLKKSIEELRY